MPDVLNEAGSAPAVSHQGVDTSAETSVNGSVSTNETTTNTEVSSVMGVTSSTDAAPVAAKAKSAPPKVNPWKTRAEKPSNNISHEAGSPIETSPGAIATESVKPSGRVDTLNMPTGYNSPTQPKQGHKLSKSMAPAIDDATLWPTLDKALGTANELSQKKFINGETPENTIASAPKVTGKEKWTKYTPTIIHTPIASKLARGGANSNKGTARNGPPRSGREKGTSDEQEVGADGKVKYTRSSDTSRPRSTKTRSMSVSNTRSERPARRESQTEDSTIRSLSTKRSERGSISAPNGGTPASDASKSPQINGSSANSADVHANDGEPRVHRASYDSSFAPRTRGGYRGHRGGAYPNTFSTRFQNSNYAIQAQSQAGRVYARDPAPYTFDQYQNFVNPAIAPMMIDPMLARQMVLNQCEYYFSIENLCKDLFLRKHMDEEGFVNLPILANFNRLRAITLDYAMIRDVCLMSSVIQLRAVPGFYDKIRRAENWEQWVLPEDQRDASTRTMPDAVAGVPATNSEEVTGDLSSSIGARAFVPGQSATDSQQPPTTALNENFANLGMGRKMSPDVKEFRSVTQQQTDNA